jgi:predicted ATPase/tRNA A-37 threonylcarbamoyl transferase component Bud32
VPGARLPREMSHQIRAGVIDRTGVSDAQETAYPALMSCTPQPDCPDDEVIARFVGGTLGDGDVARLDAHLAGCEHCLWVVTAAAVGERHDAAARPAPSSTSRRAALRFERRQLIARGGMGAVYQGYDHDTGLVVAIKELELSPAVDQSVLLGRFRREAEILRRLNHPNIVQMLASVTDGDRPQIVMEYLGGGSLRDLLRAQQRMPIERALAITLELSDALSRAHHLRIVHRDLKPENVLLADDGTPRLSDFGLAMMADSALITTDAFLGTVPYLSPEAVMGETLDARADLWALGVVLFEMLAGRRPFRGDAPAAVMNAILHQPTPDLEALCPEAPAALIDLVYRMLEKDRNQRIATARRVASELEELVGERRHSLQPTAARRSANAPPMAPLPAAPLLRLPLQTTPFIGRQTEVAGLMKLLAERDVRVVTILGPGGMGKSRLALEVCRRLAANDDPLQPLEPGAGRYRGVFFVDLAPLANADLIIQAVAEAVGFRFAPGRDPLRQLLGYLREKQLLLLMDNFEHLMSGAVLVHEILQAAAGVKVLCTSREPLRLNAETVFGLTGMITAEANASREASEADAVQLFVASANRARFGYAPSEEDAAQVARICRMVHGMPLGIVLAASWIGTLSPGEIATEISKTVDFLQSDALDLPKRQASIRAVFDQSWSLLSRHEQTALAAVSILRGGFTRSAAESVGFASVSTLASLVSKSLVRRIPETGRYEIHELLRQYAEAKLRAVPSECEAAMDRASRFYADFLSARTFRVLGPRRDLFMTEIQAEIDNIRSCVLWMLERHDAARLAPTLHTLGLFYHGRRSRPEAELLFSAIVSAFSPIDASTSKQARRVVGVALIHLALFCEEQGRKRQAAELTARAVSLLSELERDDDYALAVTIFAWVGAGAGAGVGAREELVARAEEGIALFRARGRGEWLIRALTSSFRVYVRVVSDLARAEQHLRESIALQRSLGQGTLFFADSLVALGLIRWWQGHRPEGCRLLLESLVLAESFDDVWGILLALQFAARVHRDEGDYAAAEAFARRCIAHARELGSFETVPWGHLTLGSVLLAQSRDEEAAAHFREGVAQGGDDAAILARSLLGLGELALHRREYREAERRLRESLQIYEEKRMMGGTVGALEMLGHLANAERQHDRAEEYLRRAFELARARRRPTAMTGVVAGLAGLCARRGAMHRAAELAGWVKHHAATTHSTRAQWIEPLLVELRASLGDAELCSGLERGRHMSPDGVLGTTSSL